MAEYLSPGVFIEERNAGPAVVQGVATSNFGSVGWLQRGPVGVATLVTGFDNFVDTFGSYWSNSYIPYAMAAFFQNGGSRAYVVREVPLDADKASCDVESSDTAAEFTGMAHASTIDLSGTQIEVSIDVDNAGAVDVNVVGGTPAATTLEEIVAAINLALSATIASIVTDLDGKRRIKLTSTTTGSTSEVEITDPATPANDAQDLVFGTALNGTTTVTGVTAVAKWAFTAYSEGAWANLVKGCIEGDDNYRNLTSGGWTKYRLKVYEESSLGAGDYAVVEDIGPFTFTVTDDDYIVDVVNDASTRVVVALGAGGIPWQLAPATRTAEGLAVGDGVLTTFSTYLLWPEVVRGTLTVTAGAVTLTDQGDGTLTGTGGSGTINYITGAISVTFTAAPAAATIVSAGYTSQSASTDAEACCTLTGGADGTGPLTRSQVTDPALASSERGIYAFDKIEDLINVALPDFAGSVAIANDLIAWAESKRNRFIILDPSASQTPAQVKDYRQYQGNYNTSYAALYWPWVTIQDPVTLRSKNVPPCGFVGGVIARTDNDRNVAKAPAGLNDGRIVGAIGLEYDSSQGERDTLYPYGINPLVDTPATGRAVWGARTLSLNAEWKYVQVRRLFLFLEQSVFLATHWAVFENNGPGLWSTIRTQIVSFLTNLFNEGYFLGNKASDAFRVICDSSNNPQTNIDAGLVTCDIYVAPNKPGEFIRFRFQQIVGQSQ